MVILIVRWAGTLRLGHQNMYAHLLLVSSQTLHYGLNRIMGLALSLSFQPQAVVVIIPDMSRERHTLITLRSPQGKSKNKEIGGKRGEANMPVVSPSDKNKR